MNKQPEIKIEWTSRFENNYNRYNGQRAKIRARVNELRRKMQEEPTTWLRNMEKLQDPVAAIYRDKGRAVVAWALGNAITVDALRRARNMNLKRICDCKA